MTKQKFLDTLKTKLSGLQKQDVEEHLSFYSEMIDDLIEEGLTEEEAVLKIGSVDEIVAQIMANASFTSTAKKKTQPKRHLNTWEIVLLVLGSPIWLSLAIAIISLIFLLYVVLWSVIISIWAVFGSLVAYALGVTLAGVGFAFLSNVLTGIAIIGIGITCAGLSIFLFFVCRAATKGTLSLTKKIALGIKNRFTKKEGIQ